MVQDGIWLLILFSQKNLFKLADCSSLVLRLKSTGRILSFIVQHHHNSFVVPVSMKQVVGHVCLEAFLDLYQRSDIKASVWKTIILYKNKCSSTSPSSFHTNLATLFFTFFYYSEKICLCPNSFVLFLLSFSLSLSLMGTGHKHYEKKGSGFFFFFFFLLPCNRMILAQDDGSWWMREGHFSPSSVLLNMRMALEILRAGPSLMLMIFTMSVWVSSRKASPSIIWRHRHKEGDEHHV